MFLSCSPRHEFPKPLSSINMNVDCFCPQYIFLSSTRMTILKLEVYSTRYFESCRHIKLLESYGSVENTFPPPSFSAYNSKVAKLVLSKLASLQKTSPLALLIKKKYSWELLYGVYWKMHLYLSNQWIATTKLRVYPSEKYISVSTKAGVCYSIRTSL